MFGFIEFKEDVHKENIKLAHRIKEEVCQLIDKLSQGSLDHRYHEQYPFDERRGGGQMGYRGDMGQGAGSQSGYGDRRYILDTEPSYHYPHQTYPHHFDQRQMQPQTQQFDGRYNY